MRRMPDQRLKQRRTMSTLREGGPLANQGTELTEVRPDDAAAGGGSNDASMNNPAGHGAGR